MSGVSDVRNKLISETAPTIFLKLGMKLGDDTGKKIARPDFYKNSHFGRFWPNVAKKWPKSQFLGLREKNDSNKFSKFALKVSHKIVLQDIE